MADRLEAELGRRPTDAAMRVALGVEADYLATAIAEMKDRYGSLDGYLEKAVGLDAAGRDAVRAHILL